MSFNKITLLLLAVCFLHITNCHKMTHQRPVDLLDPVFLRPHMFTKEISGNVNVMAPTRINKNRLGQIVSEEYVIDMVKTKQQILPHKMFGKTTVYAYGGLTNKGYYAGFPGPAIVAKKDIPIKITWRNFIPGPHILPVDFNYPFMNDTAFTHEVPTVPHAHGLVVNTSSDGGPESYWTMNGMKGMSYSTEEPTSVNSAVYIYPNEQDAGNYWFHDHSYGITRLNVYAGLAGLYKIVDSACRKERQIVSNYGIKQEETKYMIVTDKSFKTNGQLHYDQKSENPNFSTWMPEFYGKFMLVNGVAWPKMNLQQGRHRIVFLNACQGRFLNIWFENKGVKIPFELIRVDGTFYSKLVTVTQLLATISSRIEFVLDLSKIEGEVIMKNNAAAPYPTGDPSNFDQQFNGQILKIFVKPNHQLMTQIGLNYQQYPVVDNNYLQSKNIATNDLSSSYPKYAQGQKVFMTLFEVENDAGDVDAAFIDGISMMNGMDCPNSTYEVGKTYDFYFVNLTPDSHPMHFHLINMQKVKQFKFNVEEYSEKYFRINGGKPDRYGWENAPISLDPEEFRTGDDEFPEEHEKIFRDAIDSHTGYVTVLRVKFAKNDGSLTKSFDMRGQKYVLHCHILEHEDNEMMKYFCLK